MYVCKLLELCKLWNMQHTTTPKYHNANKCKMQKSIENSVRNIFKNLTRIFSNSSWVLCNWCSNSLIETLLSGARCANSRACSNEKEIW